LHKKWQEQVRPRRGQDLSLRWALQDYFFFTAVPLEPLEEEEALREAGVEEELERYELLDVNAGRLTEGEYVFPAELPLYSRLGAAGAVRRYELLLPASSLPERLER